MMTSAAALEAPFVGEPSRDVTRHLFHGHARNDSRDDAHTDALADAPASPVSTQDAPQIAWVEPSENIWLVSLKHFGLTLMTFGVYHFWGRAAARRRTTNAIHVNGKPLDHTGTGTEAFISFVIGAMIAISLVTLFLSMMQSGPGGGVGGIAQIRCQRLTITLPLLFLLGSVVYRKRHHILRRTWLSGQRFELTGYAWGYALQHFWMAFLVPLTLGWAAPWRASRLEAIKIREMRFGDMRFHAKPELKPLYKAFAVLWFGGGFLYFTTLIVLSLQVGPQLMSAINGLSLVPLNDADVLRRGAIVLACGLVPLSVFGMIYRKAMLEHRISSIAFDGGQLRLRLPTAGYLWLTISNVLLRVGSLGCFAPVAEARTMRYMIGHLRVEGRLPPLGT